jgi:hypothetical protein
MLVQAERLANDPPDAITLHAASSGANRDSKTETRPTLVIQERSHAKESITKTPPVRIGCIKFRLATQAPLRGESKPISGRAVALQALSSNG